MSVSITIQEALDWLEGQAMNYETANNYAMETDKYRHEDTTAWAVREVLRLLYLENERLRADGQEAR